MISVNDTLSAPRAYEVATANGTNADVTSGTACVVYGVHVSAGATGTTCTIHDGTATSADVVCVVRAVSGSQSFDFGETGIRLASGLTIVTGGSNVDTTVVRYRVE
jgi:hypothetical protein